MDFSSEDVKNKFITTVKNIVTVESATQCNIAKCYASQRLIKIYILYCDVYIPISDLV